MSPDNLDTDFNELTPGINTAGKYTPFSTPQGYFESLKDNTEKRIELLKLTQGNTADFNITEGYFEDLADQIKTRITLENFKTADSLIGMTVKPDYFETSRLQVLEKLSHSKKSNKPVIQLFRSTWIKYAAAASIVFAVATGIYIRQKENNFNNQISAVPDQEIIQYLQVNSETSDIYTIVDNLDETAYLQVDQNISDKELEQYINTSL